MDMTTITRFEASMAADVAVLLHDAFAEYRSLWPLTMLAPSPLFATVEELTAKLRGETIHHEASFVAFRGARPVAAAIAQHGKGTSGWFRIATAPEARGQGLARRCIEAGEKVLRAAGQLQVATEETVDSRWQAANALFEALGYRLDEPERRNITMLVEGWTERAVTPPEGYRLTTFTEADINDWSDCRNAVFGGDAGPEWFRTHFMSRPDFDPSGWFMIKHEGQIVAISGALDVTRNCAGEAVRGGQIEWVGVREEHRGRGLGEVVVSACLNWLAGRGVRRTILLTQPFRVPAIRLYQKLGFRTIAAWHRWVKEFR